MSDNQLQASIKRMRDSYAAFKKMSPRVKTLPADFEEKVQQRRPMERIEAKQMAELKLSVFGDSRLTYEPTPVPMFKTPARPTIDASVSNDRLDVLERGMDDCINLLGSDIDDFGENLPRSRAQHAERIAKPTGRQNMSIDNHRSSKRVPVALRPIVHQMWTARKPGRPMTVLKHIDRQRDSHRLALIPTKPKMKSYLLKHNNDHASTDV